MPRGGVKHRKKKTNTSTLNLSTFEGLALNESVPTDIPAGTRLADIHPDLQPLLRLVDSFVGMEAMVKRLEEQTPRWHPTRRRTDPSYEEGALVVVMVILALHLSCGYIPTLPHPYTILAMAKEIHGMHKVATTKGMALHALDVNSLPNDAAVFWNDPSKRKRLIEQWRRVGEQWSDKHILMAYVVLSMGPENARLQLTPVSGARLTIPLECVICFERNKGRYLKCSKCPYMFCGECWEKVGLVCPMCRQPK